MKTKNIIIGSLVGILLLSPISSFGNTLFSLSIGTNGVNITTNIDTNYGPNCVPGLYKPEPKKPEPRKGMKPEPKKNNPKMNEPKKMDNKGSKMDTHNPGKPTTGGGSSTTHRSTSR